MYVVIEGISYGTMGTTVTTAGVHACRKPGFARSVNMSIFILKDEFQIPSKSEGPSSAGWNFGQHATLPSGVPPKRKRGGSRARAKYKRERERRTKTSKKTGGGGANQPIHVISSIMRESVKQKSSSHT